MKLFLLLIFLSIGPFGAKCSEGNIPARVGKIYKNPNVGLVTFSLTKPDRLTTLDKQRMLDIHNALRNFLALGKEKHSSDGHGGFAAMPQAADMQALSWDDNLAKYAQNWADKEMGSKHSPLKGDPLLNDYVKGFLAESLSGGISAQERDMYGEIKDWNYASFSCQPGKQCGHYLAFANAQYNHLGCGFKKYKKNGATELSMVCIYGGNNPTAVSFGVARKKHQHEYYAGKPCSRCQQGWDYCMGGGLCATKKQCDGSSDCKCNHDQATCSSNGGTFNEAECTCTCPSNKMGINCATECADTSSDCMGCDILSGTNYLCEKSCGSCGSDKSAAYKWSFEKRTAPNSEGIKVRAKMEDNDEEAAKNKPKGQPYCKNKAGNKNCEILKARGYCDDFMVATITRYGCKLSCNQKCKKPETGPTDADFANLLKGSGMSGMGKSTSAVSGDLAALMKSAGASGTSGTSGSSGSSGSSGGAATMGDAKSLLASMGMGGMNLDGFKAVRRRRRRR